MMQLQNTNNVNLLVSTITVASPRDGGNPAFGIKERQAKGPPPGVMTLIFHLECTDKNTLAQRRDTATHFSQNA